MPAPTLPEVAFAGRSNVGKSSAINGVLGRKSAARVSRSPGRTQAINLFEVDKRYMLADLPGYGFAKVPEAIQSQWKGMVEGYLGSRETLRLVVCLVDSRHPPQTLDLALLGGLQGAELPFLVVATKVDKLKKSKRRSIFVKL
jgi:GTP-binding protein